MAGASATYTTEKPELRAPSYCHDAYPPTASLSPLLRCLSNEQSQLPAAGLGPCGSWNPTERRVSSPKKQKKNRQKKKKKKQTTKKKSALG